MHLEVAGNDWVFMTHTAPRGLLGTLFQCVKFLIVSHTPPSSSKDCVVGKLQEKKLLKEMKKENSH